MGIHFISRLVSFGSPMWQSLGHACKGDLPGSGEWGTSPLLFVDMGQENSWGPPAALLSPLWLCSAL